MGLSWQGPESGQGAEQDSKIRQLSLLCEVSQSISELIELERLVPFVIAKTKEILHGDGAAVLLLDEERQELFFPFTAEAAPEVDHRLAEIRVPMDRGLAGWTVRHAEPQLVHDVTTDPRWYADVDRQTGMVTRSLLSVPLRAQRGVIGVIQVRGERADAFTAADLAFLDALGRSIATAIENARFCQRLKESEARLRDQVALLHREVARSSRFSDIIGTSDAMQRVFRLVEAAVTAPVTVLLHGETGTGKELIARAIHFNGPRHDRPFVAVNCGALSEHLLESELFGHRKGAFTGASEDRKGLFEVADGGTIFLDEVGEMTAAMQVKLLRVLQDGEVLPVGERAPRWVDVRVISATNRDLARESRERRFREDLYYRLNAFPITLPPLRERRDDVPLLVAHFLPRVATRFGKPTPDVSPAALRVLSAYPWPGNVRELQNELERAVALTPEGQAIDLSSLSTHVAAPPSGSSNLAAGGGSPGGARGAYAPFDGALVAEPSAAPEPLRRARATFETQYIIAVLRQRGGNVSQAAEALGLSRSMLHKKMKEYGIR